MSSLSHAIVVREAGEPLGDEPRERRVAHGGFVWSVHGGGSAPAWRVSVTEDQYGGCRM